MACDVYWDRSMELTVTWKKNNVDLKPDGVNMVRGADNSLTINNLELKDSGRTSSVLPFHPSFLHSVSQPFCPEMSIKTWQDFEDASIFLKKINSQNEVVL